MTSQNKPVYIRLSIKNLDDDNAQVFFSNIDQAIEPLEIIPGTGQFFPKIDVLLPSMKVGDRKSIILEKNDAFGDHVDEVVKQIPLENLPEELRAPGTNIITQMENDHEIQGTVISTDDEFAVIDFNHPLAGKTVQIDLFIVKKM